MYEGYYRVNEYPVQAQMMLLVVDYQSQPNLPQLSVNVKLVGN